MRQYSRPVHYLKQIAAFKMEQLDPTAVRMQRSAFLASLGRPISPPSSVSTSEGKQFSTPAVIDLDNDAETESPRKKQRLHPRSMSRPPTTSPVPTVAKSRYLPSPFRLTRIKDLPDIDNVDAVSLHDILGSESYQPVIVFLFFVFNRHSASTYALGDSACFQRLC